MTDRINYGLAREFCLEGLTKVASAIVVLAEAVDRNTEAIRANNASNRTPIGLVIRTENPEAD